MTLELRVILAALIVLLGSGGVIYWNVHERDKGAVKCHDDDLKAAQTQLAQQAKDLAAYQKQLGEANERHQEDQRLLAAAAAIPPVHLVCHAASTSAVPGIPATSTGSTAPSGAPGDVRERDFDPGPALQRLSVGYERRVAGYRDALNQWPQTTPPPQR